MSCERSAVRPVRVVLGGRKRGLSVIVIAVRTGLCIVVVISPLSTSIDSKVIPSAVSVESRLERLHVGEAVHHQPVQLVFVGFPMGVRSPIIVGIGTSPLTLGDGARDREALLAR